VYNHQSNLVEGRDKHFLNLARSSGMKKSSPIATNSPGFPAGDTVASSKPSKPTEQLVSVPLRTHTRLDPPSQFFAVVPDVDTAAMLCHASENLASLNIMATDLARELEGPRRQVILTIQQLSALAELLVNRALDVLEPPRGSSQEPTNCPR
jgi:hypothetical protein